MRRGLRRTYTEVCFRMLQAMFSGVSGLQVHQTRLNVIGNNIANVNTIGFKSGRVTFSDQLSQTLHSASSPTANSGGQNPAQVGLGTTLGAVDTVQAQGNLQTTGKQTDMALQGNGFFMVSSGNNLVYTRDGSFDLDSSGVLVNPASGLKLIGYVADTNGKIDPTEQLNSTSVLSIPIGSLTSIKETQASTFSGNLSASAALQSTQIQVGGLLDRSQIPAPLNTTVYDAEGNAHSIQITVDNPSTPGAPVGATQKWDVTVSVDGSAQPITNLYAVGGKFVFYNSPPTASTGSTLLLNVPGKSGAPAFPLTLDFNGLQDTSSVTANTDGQASLTNPIQSTKFSLDGNMNMDSSPIVSNVTVYQVSGGVTTPFDLTVTMSNPTLGPVGPGVPANATASWDIKIDRTTAPAATIYDSTSATPQSKLYYVPGSGFVTADASGNSLGGSINLTGATPGTDNLGQQVNAGFSMSVDLTKLITTKAAGVGDGLSGPPSPNWSTSLNVYDSLGVKHPIIFKFTRTLVGTGAPGAASGRWEWSASENGNLLSDSQTAGNNPLYFDNQGKLLNTATQVISVTPRGGAAPFTFKADFSTMSQLASADSSVSAQSQDGYPVGTLQTFSISPEGLITGVFSNGQSRPLGQIATASFSNPAGLEKLGQNLFRESNNSGLAQVGVAGQNGRGKISTGFVEMSNVDLSTEFTNLIITQRGFQANTRIISIVDDLLQDVINLKR